MPAAVLPSVIRGDPVDPIASGGFAREDPPPGLRAGAADLAAPADEARRQTTALALAPAQASARPDGAAPAQPWDHPNMMAQCEKAVSYAAERAAAKQHQNIRVLRIGLFAMFAIGASLLLVGQLADSSVVTVVAWSAFVIGVCMLLTIDYGVNEYMLRHRGIFFLVIGQVSVLNTVVVCTWFFGGQATRRAVQGVPGVWAGALACTPHYLWVLWRENEIREQPEGRAFPLATELLGVHAVLFWSGILVQFIVASDDLGSHHSASTIGLLVLGIWLLVRISLARSRWGVVGGARRQRWLAMAAAGTTPTQRSILCVAVGCALQVLVVCMGSIFPPAGEVRTITVPVLYMLL